MNATLCKSCKASTQDASFILEFAAGLIQWMNDARDLFESPELATELEGKNQAEIRAILLHRGKHLL